MLFRLLRPHPGLMARFAVASLGRAGLTAASILLIQEFLSRILGTQQSLAQGVSVGASLLIVAALLLLVNLGAAAFNYDSRCRSKKS